MILRGLKFLRAPVSTPASISGITPSDTSSLCTARSLRSMSMGNTASGMPPMPVCSTAPSSIRPATLRAMAICRSVTIGLSQSAQGTRRLDKGIDVVDVNEAVAIGARHVVVDLRDHVFGAFRGGQGGVDAYAEAAESVGIGRGDFDQGHVNGHGPALKQSLDFAQVNRGVVGAAVVDGVAHVGADKDGVVPEVPRHFRGDVGRAAHGHHVHDFHVVYFRAAAHERLDQRLWLGAAGLDVNSHPRLHAPERVIGSFEPLLVFHFPRHRHRCPLP